MRSASWPTPTAELPKSTPEPASPSSPAGPPHESQVGRNQAGTRQSASPPRAPETSDVRVLRCGDQLVEVARRGPGYIGARWPARPSTPACAPTFGRTSLLRIAPDTTSGQLDLSVNFDKANQQSAGERATDSRRSWGGL